MNAILVDLGFIQIYWYSGMLFIGFLLGGYLLLHEARRFGIDDEFIINMFFYTIPVSIVGARLYYVAFNWDFYKNSLVDILKIWEGGLAIHGGVLFGLLFVIFYSKKHKQSPLRIMDMAAIGLITGQIIGRWGNFFNSEAHGPATTLETLKSLHIPNFIIEGMKIDGVYYHPTFLYEALWNLIGLIALLIIRRRRFVKVGQIVGLYMIWYGIGRFLIEIMRTDALMFNGLKVAQVASIILVVTGFIFVIRGIVDKKPTAKYNG